MDFEVKETKTEAGAKGTYTYGDYLTWSDEVRWEPSNGIPYNMALVGVFGNELVIDLAKVFSLS